MDYRNLKDYLGLIAYLDTRGTVGYVGLVKDFGKEDYAATPDTIILNPAKVVVPRDNLNTIEILEHFEKTLSFRRSLPVSGRAEIRIEDIVSVFSISEPKKAAEDEKKLATNRKSSRGYLKRFFGGR